MTDGRSQALKGNRHQEILRKVRDIVVRDEGHFDIEAIDAVMVGPVCIGWCGSTYILGRKMPLDLSCYILHNVVILTMACRNSCLGEEGRQ